MTAATIVAPHLPYLRRYARALTGRQEAGDRYVVAVLEALIADPSALPADRDVRSGLFSVFSRIWNSVPVNAHPGVVPDAPADRRLASMTPLPRQAFLLTALEGFSRKETAAILCCSEADVSQLNAEAGRQISEEVATDVLIIEDEPIIAMDLEDLVTSAGHRLIGNARTRAEAVAMIKERKPGLILADIQLADGSSGLDAVNEALQDVSVPVVFITAYPERLLTGDRPEPTFLITKPFRNDTVKAIISQALFFELSAVSPLREVG